MTATLYTLPCPHIVRLQHLSGEEWVRESFRDVADAWAWVAHMVAQAVGVDPENVECFEGKEGDMVCVDGIPVCWVVHGLPLN